MISTPTGGYTIKILNLFTLPSQAPHHAKLITIKEAETLISTSEISDAQKQHLYWLSPANLHLYLGKFRLHHSCSMLGPLTATTYFLILWKNIGSIQVWTHIKKYIEKQYEHIEKYWVYPSVEKKSGTPPWFKYEHISKWLITLFRCSCVLLLTMPVHVFAHS